MENGYMDIRTKVPSSLYKTRINFSSIVKVLKPQGLENIFCCFCCSLTDTYGLLTINKKIGPERHSGVLKTDYKKYIKSLS